MCNCRDKPEENCSFTISRDQNVTTKLGKEIQFFYKNQNLESKPRNVFFLILNPKAFGILENNWITLPSAHTFMNNKVR